MIDSSFRRLLTGTGALLASAALQMLFFLLTARSLTPAHFGQLSAIWAFALPIGELISFGSGDYLVQRVSREPRAFPHMFAGALRTIAIASPLAVLLTGFLWLLLDNAVPVWTIGSLVFSEALLMRVVALSEQIMIAHGDIAYANLQRVLVSSVRLAGGGFLYAISAGETDLTLFSIFYLTATSLSALISIIVIFGVYGLPRHRRGIKAVWHTSFAIHNVGRSVSQTLDRLILSFVLTAGQLGLYGAGARTLQVGLLPLLAHFRETYPGFFRAGRGGVGAAWQHCLSLSWRIAGVTAASTLAALTFALLLPLVLGPKYSQAVVVGMIVALSTIPLAVQFAVGDILTGANLQRLRTWASVSSLITAVPLMIVGALMYGAVGAAIVNLFVQVLTAAVLVLVVRWKIQRE